MDTELRAVLLAATRLKWLEDAAAGLAIKENDRKEKVFVKERSSRLKAGMSI